MTMLQNLQNYEAETNEFCMLTYLPFMYSVNIVVSQLHLKQQKKHEIVKKSEVKITFREA